MDWLPDTVLNHLREAGAAEAPNLSGTRYELAGELGRGGMGTVYIAHDRQLDREVALKVLHLEDPSGAAAARMLNEARILARLEHPGIVPVQDAGTLADGRVFYAMKLVRGERLDRYRESGRALPDVLRVFLRICETVAFAHSHGIIHRDLKPENVMVGKFGEVLVLDWGVAKVVGNEAIAGAGRGDAPETLHGTVVGTRDYMAPEQAAGAIDQVDARSDVYALGKTLEFLAGARAPRRLAAICRKATQGERAARYQSATEMSADIARYLDGEAVTAHRETILERAGRVLARNKMVVALVVAYLLARAVLLFLARR